LRRLAVRDVSKRNALPSAPVQEGLTMLPFASRLVVGIACSGSLVLGCAGSGSTPGSGDAGPDGAVASGDAGPGDDDDDADDAGTPRDDAASAGACPSGPDGLDCLFDLLDEVAGSCDAERLDDLRASLTARHGELPAWHAGRALFVSEGGAASIAGEFNDWQDGALATAALCGSDLYVADAAIASGRWEYKLVVGGSWQLDPLNWGFAFDAYELNADGKNSVVNTYDSGLGHLVRPPDELCSTALDSCRRFTTYLPAGYGAPANAARQYPVVFMHDGQNIFDEQDCCFGHTGWEVNVALDGEIAEGNVEPVVIVGFEHGGAQRNDEYGWSTSVGGLQETFMAFQVDEVQPTAAGYWRLDPARYYTAGSSLGGLISFRLAYAYPAVYRGAASLSGAFWPGQDTSTAMRDIIDAETKKDVALYLDHGGDAQSGGDGYADSIEIRDLLVDKGWTRSDSPSCTANPDAVCYHHEPGATHDELAWRDRTWRFLRFFFGS
jgi:predicted alpha/beta superfamily hydrolase